MITTHLVHSIPIKISEWSPAPESDRLRYFLFPYIVHLATRPTLINTIQASAFVGLGRCVVNLYRLAISKRNRDTAAVYLRDAVRLTRGLQLAAERFSAELRAEFDSMLHLNTNPSINLQVRIIYIQSFLVCPYCGSTLLFCVYLC
jgi:hypothetical protein